MANIVIYSKNKSTPIAGILSEIDDAAIRVEDGSIMREHTMLNPSLIIVEDVDNLTDILMTTKFICPLLFVGERFNTIVRAEGYDFISSPVNKDELLVRAKALLKISYYKNRMMEVSTTDELTGLHNRKYLQEALEAEISRSRRYKTKVSCILFDLDFFKAVNDMYGYEWGDILLRNISSKLADSVRREDIVTRYGDEEFLLILPNTSEDNAFIYVIYSCW